MSKSFSYPLLLLLIVGGIGCSKSKTSQGAEFPATAKGVAGACYEYKTKDKKFKWVTQQAKVETRWYKEWTDLHGETLPEPLPPPDHWMHPMLSSRYAATMHEDSFATDVSREPGPLPNGAKVEYFHVLEKGTKLSGMAPFFTFLDDNTVVTISFGRDSAMLLIIDISGGESKLLDYVALPGRGSKALELSDKKARMAMFRDTSGGAYSYLDAQGRVYVPGADNTIVRITIRDRKVVRDEMVLLDLNRQVAAGSWISDAMEHPDNHLTAIMPDASGKVWFTSKFGIIGFVDINEGSGICPDVYVTHITHLALEDKVRQYYEFFGESLPPGAEEYFAEQKALEGEDVMLDLQERRRKGKEIFGDLWTEDEPWEQIQNSFSVGPDGVYMATNVALYKLYFDEKTQQIELDPKWAPNYKLGELVYDNDRNVKPGHLNNGTGTTPTLIDDRFVAIVDNAPSQVNLNVFRQEDGRLVSKLPLFEPGAGAVENSVVAYGDSLLVGNTYGYVDPFIENETAGGIMRFDYDHDKGTYVKVEGWPATGHFDAKTATPKLSTANGLFYAYQRDMEQEGRHDWQLTAVDFRTGLRVYSLKPSFTNEDFDDNVSSLVVGSTLGEEDYGKKVFNNIWGTFSFGPQNSVYLGVYRGYIRFYSASTLD
jgi:hypothetical protein